ncbi:MAG: translation initiation factor IF-2 N-terminal domain-containing protein, partial [Acidobacteriota bacterium]
MTKEKKKVKSSASEKQTQTKKKTAPELSIREGTTLKEFCEKLNYKGKDILEKLEKEGFIVNINDIIIDSLVEPLSKIIGKELKIISIEEEIHRKTME